MEFQKSPDGGWGWVIVVVSFFTQFLSYGSPLAVGVLYVEWLDAFGEGKGKTAWVGSLASGVGLLASLGCGLLYTATVTITCQYFDSRRGLALGLISTGSSVGLFIYAALQRMLIEFYGLDGCLLIVGALALNILACGSLMRPLQTSDCPFPEKTAPENVPDRYSMYNEKEKNQEETMNFQDKGYGSEDKCLPNGDWGRETSLPKSPTVAPHTKEPEPYKKKVVEQTNFCKQLAKRKWQLYRNYCRETASLFKNKVFSALFIAILLFDIGGFPPSLLMEDVARSYHVREEDFTMPLISIFGIMTAVGKLLLGILADFKWINTLYLYVATLIITGLALCAIPFAKSYVTLAILSGILGFLTGNWSIFPYVTTKTVGIDRLAHAYGILMFFAGLGNSLGPPIVGWFYDWTQTYDIAFYFSGFCVLLGGFVLLLAILPCWDMCNKRLLKPAAPTTFFYKVASTV
ncbi:monocarboxylate transporter 9 isoform X2 [Apodemus sylvaticus]|uniref:monocarboxylate transporter 9 isoform X2 n=1 Tax=Apodemus sylvaticus TaxID=10129 RepID=UPI002244A8FF|nr:monocarboxylate transporter 9 isoform X2 [Apodemus sylvaticus]